MSVRWGPLLASAGFTVIAVAILVFDPEERALGWMCLLFFGGCTVILAAPLLSRSNRRVRIVSDGLEAGFLFPLGRAKQVALIVAAFGMAIAGVFITISGNLVIGFACTGTMGGFGVVALVRMMKGGHGLLLTPTRVVVNVGRRTELAWDEIESVGLYGDASARTLGINTVNPIPRGALAQINRAFNPADIVLPVEQLVGDPEHALRMLTMYLEQPESRGAIGTETELARVM
jgi:hypothetical protein